MTTHEDLLKLQDTNNKAILTVREMIGNIPWAKADAEALALFDLLIYAQQKIENDIAAVAHGQHV